MFRQILPPVLVIIFFFLALFLYTRFAGPISFSVNSVTTQKTDTFNVNGEGKISISPDLAIVNAGITSNGSTVKGVQDQINSTINKVSDEVKKLGVDNKDIQTSGYSINPTYDYISGSQKITGYTANTNLTIKVKDLEKINQVIDTATANGANQINGLSFDVADRKKAEDEARKKAVEDGKKKAEAAAKIAGFKLGRLVNYYEAFNEPPITLQRGGGDVALEAEVIKDTQLQEGSLEIVVNVTLSYEIR